VPKNPVNPKEHDYNKDGRVTESDWEIGKKDANKDGRVTPQEEKKYNKERGSSVSETKFDSEGRPVKTTTTGPSPEETRGFSRADAEKAGFTKEFLKRNPDVAKLVRDAIKFNYTEQEFVKLVETDTKWGQRTTDAQAAFDLRYYGDKQEDVKVEIRGNRDLVRNLASTLGVTLTEQEINAFAFRYTRAALKEQDLLDFLASKYRTPGQTETGQTEEPGEPQVSQGTAAQLTDEIRRMARSYGVTLTPESLEAKVQEGLRQGDRWMNWVEGQRNVFRQNAKTLYPSGADKFDEYTLEELLNPYLEDASMMLGIRRENMDMTNPMWTKALTNPDGSPMTREQWMTTLRTDKQYGWSKTQNAKTEMADLGNELLRAFGMA
jgi:hypothetical protein